MNSPPAEEPDPTPRVSPQQRTFDEHYRDFYRLLLTVVTGKFRIPPDDAEAIVQEVFIAYLGQLDSVTSLRTWLIAVACNMSRNYWRGKHRTEPLALDHTENYGVDAPCTAETYERQLLVEQALASVSERSQRVLRMHYMEGYSAREIAETLATSTRYAEKMIHVAMRDVRSAYKGFESHD